MVTNGKEKERSRKERKAKRIFENVKVTEIQSKIMQK